MLAQRNASSLPRGDNSLSKERPDREMRRKYNLKQAKREEALTLGRSIGKGTVKKKETYNAGKDRSEIAEFGERLETMINTL